MRIFTLLISLLTISSMAMCSTIKIGQIECPGREWHISNNATTLVIKQLSVINQYSKEGTGGASCGYHALLNAEHIVQALDARQKSMITHQEIQHKFGDNGVWRKAIITERTHGDVSRAEKGNWLDHCELMDLADKDNINVIVFAQPEEIGSGGCYDTTAAIKQGIKNKRFTKQAFCLGSMSHQTYYPDPKEKEKGKKPKWVASDGHWIAAVLHKLDSTTYELILADSASGNSLFNASVQRLVGVVFGDQMHAQLMNLVHDISQKRVLAIVAISEVVVKVAAVGALIYGLCKVVHAYMDQNEHAQEV